MILRCVAYVVALFALLGPSVAAAQDGEKRIALVIGNAAYQAGELATPANDAGLVAQTLQAAGFDVVGSRDLDQDTLRRAFRDFLDKAQASGPDTVAFVYLSGYGLQLEGENYFVPVDARIARDVDVPAEALRISDYARPLAALNLKASIIVLDAARAGPFAQSGAPLAGGLALVEPEPGVLIAFNAAPGTVAPQGQGPYGPYAQALAEMMREGGMPLGDVFDRVRLRVNDVTGGAQVPWHASQVQAPFVFFERAPDAPPPAVSVEQRRVVRDRPIRDLDAEEAYMAALDRDTMEGYLDFLAAYPDTPMAQRIRAIVAARREAITWRRTRHYDSPAAYWSYLRRYPEGPHAPDARRRLAFLAAALEPPPSFPVLEYDVAPPPPEENVFVDRPVLAFDNPTFAFEPPPPPVVFFLPPPPPEFEVLPPPPPPVALFVLPVPEYRPVPLWVRPPEHIARPPLNNVIYSNVHNTVVINNTTNTLTITNPSGQTTTVPPPVAPAQPAAGTPPVAPAPGTPVGGPGAGTAPAGQVPQGLIGPALPPSVARKALAIQGSVPSGPTPPPGTPPGQLRIPPGQPPQLHQLPGQQGQPPLHPGQPQPQQAGRPPTPPPGQPPLQQGNLPGQQVRPSLPGQQGQPSLHPGQPQPQQAGRPPTPPPGQPPLQQGNAPGQQVQPSGAQQQLDQQRQKQLDVERQKQADQERLKQGEQQRQKQLELDRQKQAEQERLKQGEQQRQKQLELDRQKQAEQERLKQGEQQRQKQLELDRQKQIEQQRQQQIQQQRQQQLEQQRQQQQQQQQQIQQQQRQQQLEQQRQQQIQQQQQRQQQLEQQRQQQIQQQQQQQRQQQLEQQRQQQIQQQQQQQRQQQLEQQRQQQIQQQQRQQQQQKKPPCGGPGQPPCPK
jgi:uncharacterized caspase-like protein